MSIWQPPKKRTVVSGDVEQEISLADAMQGVCAGVLWWCDHCHAYHGALLNEQGHVAADLVSRAPSVAIH